jgi:hypothetical protein
LKAKLPFYHNLEVAFAHSFTILLIVLVLSNFPSNMTGWSGGEQGAKEGRTKSEPTPKKVFLGKYKNIFLGWLAINQEGVVLYSEAS